MDEKNRNLLLAVVLSVVVLFVWQALVIGPQRQAQQQQAQQQQTTQQPGPQTQSQTGTPSPSATGEPSASSAPGAGAPGLPAATASRDAAIAETQRVPIDTPRLRGSINLKGGRIDDLTLKKYRVAVDKDSSNVTLLSPSGSPAPNRAFYAQHG
jgi:YidC/Oxa1 family membrane protein insertase